MAAQGEAQEIMAIRGGNGAEATPAPSHAISYAERTKRLRRTLAQRGTKNETHQLHHCRIPAFHCRLAQRGTKHETHQP